jgi:hypothetical protein
VKTQTIDFCGFFSLYNIKERRNNNDHEKEKRRTWKLRPHLAHALEEEEDVEDVEEDEEETLVATRLAKCLSMVFVFLLFGEMEIFSR